MDFVSDVLFNGKRFRSLTVVDAYTRKCLVIHVDQGIKGEQAVHGIDRLLFQRGIPARQDRGGQWAEVYLESAGSLGLHQPGYLGLIPVWQANRQFYPELAEGVFVESFNARFRDE
jgi:putative transposase